MLDKQKAHASAIAKMNATIQELEKEKQDYINMHYELVDEVDGIQKCAKDTFLGVSKMLQNSRDKQHSQPACQWYANLSGGIGRIST